MIFTVHEQEWAISKVHKLGLTILQYVDFQDLMRNDWETTEKWLWNNWEMTENDWKMIEKWLKNGWKMTANDWKMTEKWLKNNWEMTEKW